MIFTAYVHPKTCDRFASEFYVFMTSAIRLLDYCIDMHGFVGSVL